MTPDGTTADEAGARQPAGFYPLVVLGGAPAGVFAAEAAARRGVRTALVIPPAEPLPPSEPTPLGKAVRAMQVRTGLSVSASPPEAPGVDVFVGRAVFHRPRTIAVGDREVGFRRAIVAAGTRPAAAAFDVAEPSGWLRPETLGRLTEVPKSLAVVGLGAEGCAWAAAFQRLGSQVHLIGHDAEILSSEAPEAAAAVRGRLERDGVRLYPNCGELAVEATGNLRSVLLRHAGRKEKLLVDEVLFCGPRRPNTGDLNLEAAGVACDAEGVLIDDKLRTSNRRVLAAGGICGRQFDSLQAARATAELAACNATSWLPRSLERLVISHLVPTEPAIARAALAEPRRLEDPEARRPLEVDTLRAELSGADSTLPDELREGFVQVRVERGGGRIVEAQVVAQQADELLAPLALLMSQRLPLAALAESAVPPSSRCDVLVRLAGQVQEPPRPRVMYLNCCGVPPRE